MSFLRSIAKLFSQEPLLVRLTLAPNGVALALFDGKRLLEKNEIISDKVLAKLPLPLVTLVNNQLSVNRQPYLLTLTHALKLFGEIKSYTLDKIQFDGAAVENLEQVAHPADFRIHWYYDADQQSLKLQCSGADYYLGDGWFCRQQKIWRLSDMPLDPVIAWLHYPEIAGSDIFKFVSTVLPLGQRVSLPLSCDLRIETDFRLKLNIVRMLKKSLEVQLTANMPIILANLRYLEGDPLNMISRTALLPDLRPYLTPQFYRLAQTSGLQKIEGKALPGFLQDELKPHAAFWEIDIAPLNEAYPIIDAGSLTLVWKLVHEEVGGIGCYKAIPWLEVGPISATFKSITDTLSRGARFERVGDYWLEFTEVYKQRHRNWIGQQVATFELATSEILGANSKRLSATGLSVPAFNYQHSVDEIEDVDAYLDCMNQHGLPVVLTGLQKDMPNVLAGICQKLLQNSPRARILWLVTKSRLPITQAALQRKGVVTHSSFSTRAGKPLAAGIYLSLPTSLPTNIEWNLCIFYEIDTLSLSDEQSKLYCALQRRWSVVTFERKQRAEQDWLLSQAIHLSQASDVSLSVFRQTCLKAYSDQEEGWFAKLKSPFKKLFGSDEPAEDVGSVPIPRRPAPLPGRSNPVSTPESHLRTKITISSPSIQPQKRPARQSIPLPQITNVFRPAFTDPETVSVARGSFIERARHFADHTGDQTVAVPFMEYWPTYDVMNDAQLRWYFYWRTQVRQANFLHTDTSYLFLHVYEVLHLIGFSTPQSAFDYLVKFWEHYRALQPKLDNYLVNWLADFLVVYDLPQSPLNWYATLVPTQNRVLDLDLATQAWLQTDSDFATLNTNLLYELAGYSPSKNKFYQAHNQANRLDQAYKQGLQAINVYLQQGSELSLFAQHRPSLVRTIERVAFAGANYEGSKASIKIADIYPWSSSKSLALALQQIIKYTENLLREQAGFKQKLRGVEIAPAWATILDQIFIRPTNRTSIVSTATRRELNLDLSKVAILRDDSEAIRHRLLTEDESASDEIVESVGPNNQQSATSISGGYLERSTGVAEHLLTDLARVAAVIGDTTTHSAKILRVLREQNWSAQSSVLTTALAPQFLNVIIDLINERAIAQIGDALLFEEYGYWVVADDYRDEIVYILDHPDYTVTDFAVTSVSMDIELPIDNIYSNLEAEWAKFVQQMQPLHWEGLAVLLHEQDIVNRLDTVARSSYITANQLIDEINTFALNSIGDVVIDTSSEIPVIEMEDIENLRMLMQWAIDHTLVYQ